MNRLLWILQFFLGLYFFSVGIMHFIVPPGLPAMMAWMYDLPAGLHYFTGVTEILAGLGLILPGLTRIQTRLTPLAALGIVALMAGALVFHIPRNELANAVQTGVLAGLAGFVAYGRWRLSPLKDKVAA